MFGAFNTRGRLMLPVKYSRHLMGHQAMPPCLWMAT